MAKRLKLSDEGDRELKAIEYNFIEDILKQMEFQSIDKATFTFEIVRDPRRVDIVRSFKKIEELETSDVQF